MNNQQRAENAITWINRLLNTRLKQGKHGLGRKEWGFCPLAIGLLEHGVRFHPLDKYARELIEICGLNHAAGRAKHPKSRELLREGHEGFEAIWKLNDDLDYTFNQVGKHLIEKAHYYFRPGVAKLIRKHYSSTG